MATEKVELSPETAPDANLAEAEVAELRRRLEEALHTLDATQNGSVDAVVVNGPKGNHRGGLALIIEQGLSSTVKHTLRLDAPAGPVPVQITLSPLSGGDHPTCCAVVVDLREREQAERARGSGGSGGRQRRQ